MFLDIRWPPKVFISYVRDNTQEVHRLCDDLKRSGIDVWLDLKDLEPGQRWKDVVKDAISQGDYFIACFSQESEKRAKTYMREELILACEELRQRPRTRVWFIPVRISPCEIPELPIGPGETLRDIQTINLWPSWPSGIYRIINVVLPRGPLPLDVQNQISRLRSDDPKIRREAADALREIGNPAAIPALFLSLRDEERSVQWASVWALAELGEKAGRPPFLGGFCHNDPRITAAIHLWTLGGESVHEWLLIALKDHDPFVRQAASIVLELSASDKLSPQLIDIVNSAEGDTAADAIRVLGVIGDQRAVLPLTEVLGKPSERARRSAAEALGHINTCDSMRLLVATLSDESVYVRSTAAEALGKITAVENDEAVRALTKAVWDSSWRVSHAAIEALGKIGSDYALPSLIRALHEGDQSTRITSSLALGEIGNRDAVHILIKSLLDSDCGVRVAAAKSLGKIDNKEAIPALEEVLQDEFISVKWEAAKALADLGSKAGLPVFIESLETKHCIRESAEILARFYEPTEMHRILSQRKVIPLLAAALQNKKTWYSDIEEITQALAIIGGRQAFKTLSRALNKVRTSMDAARALAKLGTNEALNVLELHLKHKNKFVRLCVSEALANIGRNQGVPNLIEALQDDDAFYCMWAAKALGILRSSEAVPHLSSNMHDKSLRVRLSAVEAVTKIKTPACISILEDALFDVDEQVRKAAAYALGIH